MPGSPRSGSPSCESSSDAISAARRDELIGTETTVLVDEVGVARSHREAPEIDGVVLVPDDLAVGEFHSVHIVDARGPDLQPSPSRPLMRARWT